MRTLSSNLALLFILSFGSSHRRPPMDAVGAASWIVQVVLEKLVGDAIDAAWAAAASGSDPDPGSDVRCLRSRLQSLHLVLSAAQERVPRARGEALLSSLERLRSLAGDADNLLDEMLYYQIHRQLHPDQASDSCSSISAVQAAISMIRSAKRARLGDNDTIGRIKEILSRCLRLGMMSVRQSSWKSWMLLLIWDSNMMLMCIHGVRQHLH